MACGRDAADAAITTSFGQALLTKFEVVTEEVLEQQYSERELQRA